jgi:hypothetical protein
VAFKSAQVAVAGTAVPLWQPPGGTPVGNEPVLNSQGSLQDPVPIIIVFNQNVYLGGSGVTAANGALWPANAPLGISNITDQLFAIDAGTAATAFVLVGRQ